MFKRLLIAIPLATLGAAWFSYLSLPWPVLLRFRNPGQTAFIELRIDEARGRGDPLRIRQTWLPLSKISRNLRRAVSALRKSLSYYRAHRDRVRGRSTLTQQLAKNLYFSESRSVTRKIGEFVVARRLEWFLSKDR